MPYRAVALAHLNALILRKKQEYRKQGIWIELDPAFVGSTKSSILMGNSKFAFSYRSVAHAIRNIDDWLPGGGMCVCSIKPEAPGGG